jgi:hypothetical protein
MGDEPKYRVGRDEHGLTIRDRQVRDLLAKGKKQIEIAEELGVGKQRVQQIVAKLRAMEADPPVPPEKLERVWAFLARNEAGDERLVSVTLSGVDGETIMVAGDDERRDELEQVAQVLADRMQAPLELVRFTERRHVKTIRPVRA